jgi:hypothetical protein
MNIGLISLALISFLLTSVLVFAFFNRNHYPDLVFAALASFCFGAASLISAFKVNPFIFGMLRIAAESLIIISISLLIIRLGRNILKRYRSFIKDRNDQNDNSDDPI